ncbi:MAG: M48 family metalloprotease [Anaerolineales bacterium]
MGREPGGLRKKMRKEEIKYATNLVGYFLDFLFGIWIWKSNPQFVLVPLTLWFLVRLMLTAVRIIQLKVRNFPKYMTALLPDISGIALIPVANFTLINYREWFLALIMFFGILLFLYPFVFEYQLDLTQRRTVRVEDGILFAYIERINLDFGTNLSLSYGLKTGMSQIDYNVHVDQDQKIIMGEGFYTTTELSNNQKISILSHEAGHNKYNHSRKLFNKRVLAILVVSVALFLGIWVDKIAVYSAFGLLLLSRPIIQSLSNICSVRQEYQADRFAIQEEHRDKSDLMSAIKFLTAWSHLAQNRMWWHKLFITDHPSSNTRPLWGRELPKPQNRRLPNKSKRPQRTPCRGRSVSNLQSLILQFSISSLTQLQITNSPHSCHSNSKSPTATVSPSCTPALRNASSTPSVSMIF